MALTSCLGPLCGRFHDELGGSDDEAEDEEEGAKSAFSKMTYKKNKQQSRSILGGWRRSKKKEAAGTSGGGTLKWASYINRVNVKVTVRGQETTAPVTQLRAVEDRGITTVMLRTVHQLPALYNVEIVRCGADEIPASLHELENLAKLDMSHNNITVFDKDLSKCKLLETLILEWNKIPAIPTGVFSKRAFGSLQVLNVSHNRLSSLPSDFGIMHNARFTLKAVNLSNNSLHAIPDSITECKSLKEIDFSHNKISQFPKRFVMEKLQVLFLSFNELTELPETIGRCKELERIRIISNRIRELPPSILQLWKGEGKPGRLIELLVDRNPLEMPTITAFQMDKNPIDRAFRLLQEHLDEVRAKQARALEEEKRALLESAQLAALQDAQAEAARGQEEGFEQERSKGGAQPALVQRDYYFSHCTSEEMVAEIRDAETALLVLKRHMYLEGQHHLAEEMAKEDVVINRGDAPSLGFEVVAAEEGLLVRDLSEVMAKRCPGLHNGSIVVKVDGHPVANLADFTRRTANLDEFTLSLRNIMDVPEKIRPFLDHEFRDNFNEKVPVKDLDIYFNLLVLSLKPAYPTVVELFSRFDVGGKGYLTREEWEEFCIQAPVELDFPVVAKMWSLIAHRRPNKMLLHDFIAAWHIHDIDGSRDSYIKRVADVLQLDYYDMTPDELTRRIQAKDAAEASPQIDFDNAKVDREVEAHELENKFSDVVRPVRHSGRRGSDAQRSEEHSPKSKGSKEELSPKKRGGLPVNISMTEAEYLHAEADDSTDSDANSNGSLSSQELSSGSESDAGGAFDAAIFARQREALSESRKPRSQRLVVDSDRAIQQLMSLPVADLLHHQEVEHVENEAANLNPVVHRKKREKGPRRKVTSDVVLKTDVFALRQGIREAYRNMPYYDFVALIQFLLRGLLAIKMSADHGLTYWHEDDPSFKHTMGEKETNKYTRRLLVLMGFVKLSNRYWVWPKVHLAKDVWGRADVPHDCPGEDPNRLDDVILLLKSCKMSLRKTGTAFTGHFQIRLQ